MNILIIPLVILSGMGLSFEAGLLGPLGEVVGHLWATFSIFSVGMLLLGLLNLYFPAKAALPLSELPRWQLIGGILGPVYVVVLTVSTPILGVTMTMIGILAGQVSKGILIDHFGWYGATQKRISPFKLFGCLLITLALLFTYLGA